MKILEAKIRQIDTFKSVALRIVREELIKERVFISSLVRKQLNEGKRGDGTDMPEYSPRSKKSGKINLFDKGDFHRGIEPLFETESFEILDVDSKTDMLVKKYGQILKLLPENISLLSERIRPRIRDRILAELL